MTTKHFSILVGVASLTVISISAAQHLGKPTLHPFTVTRVDNGTPDDPPTVMTIAVRADGSRVEFGYYPNPITGRPSPFRRIFDFATGRDIFLQELTHSTKTVALSPDYQVKPASVCKGVSAGKWLGYEVFQDTMDSTVGELRCVMTRVAAPRLGCFPLKEETIFTDPSGREVAHSRKSVSEVRLGANDSLFEVPEGYTERSPSEIMKLLHELYPNVWRSVPDMTVSDSIYYANRPR